MCISAVVLVSHSEHRPSGSFARQPRQIYVERDRYREAVMGCEHHVAAAECDRWGGVPFWVKSAYPTLTEL